MSTTSSVSSSSSGLNLASILAAGDLATTGSSTASATTASSAQTVTGLASGMDWSTVITELADAERAPETKWKADQTTLATQKNAFTTIATDLATLQTDLKSLTSSSLWKGTASTASNASVATVASTSGAATGSNTFEITQLATAAKITGNSNVSTSLASSNKVSNVIIGTAGFPTAVTAGRFTVNGKPVTVATTDSLQDVFDAIASATDQAVTASYDATTDEITLTGSSPITLGSTTDTSNFLQAAKLYNNSSDSVSSSSALGRVNTTVTMTGADLATAITTNGNATGKFTINGVSISYDASSDSIQNVLDNINSSAAGVTAAYDTVNNRFTLTNSSTGDVGISMKDVTGNFLAATGLAGGTLTRGQNLLYTLNGGTQQLVSQSNTITDDSSGITGLSVTALSTGSVTATVGRDTSSITTAIKQFITDYNTVQSFITTKQANTTATDGTVTAGTLNGDQTASSIVSNLRSLSYVAGSGLTSDIKTLGSLGIDSNGQNNTLTLSDSSTLDDALTSNLSAVESFFSDTTNGVAAKLNNYITNLTGTNGDLTNHQASLTQQYGNIGTQITNLETKITSDKTKWTSEFTAMDVAESKTSQELTYLSQQVSNGSL
jgi:flagellar hook-associated protein 2